MKKEKKPLWKKMRHPVPKKIGGPITTKKGKKGYNRKRIKRELQEELTSSEEEVSKKILRYPERETAS